MNTIQEALRALRNSDSDVRETKGSSKLKEALDSKTPVVVIDVDEHQMYERDPADLFQDEGGSFSKYIEWLNQENLDDKHFDINDVDQRFYFYYDGSPVFRLVDGTYFNVATQGPLCRVWPEAHERIIHILDNHMRKAEKQFGKEPLKEEYIDPSIKAKWQDAVDDAVETNVGEDVETEFIRMFYEACKKEFGKGNYESDGWDTISAAYVKDPAKTILFNVGSTSDGLICIAHPTEEDEEQFRKDLWSALSCSLDKRCELLRNAKFDDKGDNGEPLAYIDWREFAYAQRGEPYPANHEWF